jgi:hypothetical protein
MNRRFTRSASLIASAIFCIALPFAVLAGPVEIGVPHIDPIAPDLTPRITPDLTPQITPDLTPQITPDLTPQFTPQPQFAPQPLPQTPSFQQQAVPGNGSSGSTNNLNASIVFRVRSSYQYNMQLAFYSQNRQHVWPGYDRAYELNDYDTHAFQLACEEGERICYGAWPKGRSSPYWGVGYGGQQGCKSCCWVCGQNPGEIHLQ